MTNKEKANVKIDELKQKRAGKTQNMAVTLSEDPTMNFQHCLNEIQKVLQLHKMAPVDVDMMGNQLKWMAMNNVVMLNMQQVVNHIGQRLDLKVDKPVEEKAPIKVKEEVENVEKEKEVKKDES